MNSKNYNDMTSYEITKMNIDIYNLSIRPMDTVVKPKETIGIIQFAYGNHAYSLAVYLTVDDFIGYMLWNTFSLNGKYIEFEKVYLMPTNPLENERKKDFVHRVSNLLIEHNIADSIKQLVFPSKFTIFN